MDLDKKLNRVETVGAVAHTLWFTIKSSPAFLLITAIEEVISRIAPFASAWVLANLVSTLPVVVHNAVAQHLAVRDVVALLLINITPSVISSFTNYYGTKQRIELDLKVDRRLQMAFSALPFAFYEDKETMDAYDRASRFAMSLSSFVLYRLRYILGGILTFLFAAVAFWHFSPYITIAVLVLSIPTMWVEFHMQRVREKIWKANTTNSRRAYAYEDLVKPRLIKESRLLGLAAYAIEHAQHFKRVSELAQLGADRQTERYRTVSMLLSGAVEALVLLRALQRIVLGQIPIGQFVFVQQVASQYLGAITGMAGQVQSVDDLLFGLAEFTAITTYKVEEPSEVLANPSGDITFDHVSFSYPGTKALALKDVSLSIPHGKTIAIVGENGAGKTTLVKLIMKLYDPLQGAITIGGQSLAGTSGEAWHAHIGALFQDFSLFYDFTIRDNVWFGNIKKDREGKEIESVLKAAEAASFVKELPFGMDTYLGKYVDEENGTDLSGGQAQRLAIARAIFRRPDLLILDEPTSAIDAKAEYTIFKAIDAARQGRTTILISHRFSTVRKADYIYVLEKGRLKEQGTHEELLARRGLYHEMFTKQAAGYL